MTSYSFLIFKIVLPHHHCHCSHRSSIMITNDQPSYSLSYWKKQSPHPPSRVIHPPAIRDPTRATTAPPTDQRSPTTNLNQLTNNNNSRWWWSRCRATRRTATDRFIHTLLRSFAHYECVVVYSLVYLIASPCLAFWSMPLQSSCHVTLPILSRALLHLHTLANRASLGHVTLYRTPPARPDVPL